MAKTPKHILKLRKEIDNLVPKLRPLTEHQSMQLAMQTSRASWNDCTIREYNTWGHNGQMGKTTKRVTSEYKFATVIDRCGDWNVVRYFVFHHCYYKTKPNVHEYINEVRQFWIAPDGTTICREVALKIYHWNYYNPFSHWADLRFKQYESGYETWEKVLLVRSMTPQLRRCGLRTTTYGINPEQLISAVLGSSYAETLWKRKDFTALGYLISKKDNADNLRLFTTAHKIAARNHYDISDYGLWWDMIAAWNAVGKDIHSPHYVCPTDFMQSHDRAVAQLARLKDAIELAKQISDSVAYEAEYKTRIDKYRDIVLSTDDYVVFACPSVRAMAEEGQKMHHCVFRMGYYKPEKNCVILFVRSKNNERISTIELSTKSWKIMQNRGVNNSVPMYYNEVNQLVMDNIKLFKNAGKKQKAKVISINQPLTQAA